MDEQISKKAALVAVKDALMAWSYMPEWRDEKILEAIAELPPAEPKRGKWLDDGDPLMLTCGNCGDGVMRYNNTPFCPNCGQKKEVANGN